MLRPGTEHTQSQNWSATCIDVVIGIAGAFIGVLMTLMYQSSP